MMDTATISHQWYIPDWAQAGHKDTSKVHEEVAQVPMVPTPVTMTSAPKHASMAS